MFDLRNVKNMVATPSIIRILTCQPKATVFRITFFSENYLPSDSHTNTVPLGPTCQSIQILTHGAIFFFWLKHFFRIDLYFLYNVLEFICYMSLGEMNYSEMFQMVLKYC